MQIQVYLSYSYGANLRSILDFHTLKQIKNVFILMLYIFKKKLFKIVAG